MGHTSKNIIPFKVSARTARLIGRENIASSKGAIIELVKNGYDADSRISIVFFDNKYSTFLEELDEEHLNGLVKRGIAKNLFFQVYEYLEDDEIYKLKEETHEEILVEFRQSISKFSTLYIIDSGEGMTQNIIREHWMTIGTDNKANNVFTTSGRVKAGAKGIGRFALDKLGNKCQMTTVFNPDPEVHEPDKDSEGNLTNNTGYNWIVDWSDFEGEFKTIDSVGAILEGIQPTTFKEELLKIDGIDLSLIEAEKDFKFGTILKISELRDNWEDYFVEQVYSDLEVLVPPKETGGFEIYVFSSLFPNKYGEVLGSICDDYDYKLVASADNEQNVRITVYRNEYDLELIPNDFFEREAMQKENYRRSDFERGYWEKTTTFSKLMKGFKVVDNDRIFENIGVFDFTFYFLKRGTDSINSKKYFNKDVMSSSRKDWLNKFGGIKLFRDNFRVRPYGEIKDTAFDWLGLGNRKTMSPAGIGKKEGGYKVGPENVAGAIGISRLTNVNFEDKSSREGLQENKTFQIFKNLIASIISEFEKDRAYISREMADYYRPEGDRIQAEKIKVEILKLIGKNRNNQIDKEQNRNDGNLPERTEKERRTEKEKEILAVELDRKEEEIEQLKNEQKVLRGLASSGIVLASFSHDLSKLNDVLTGRTKRLKKLISEKISEDDYKEVVDRNNPFRQIEKIRKQDLKFQNWLNFSLGATRKDKRKRRQLFLKSYLTNFKNDWLTVLEERAISFVIADKNGLHMRIFEIDLDSIFNNLLVNSIDAFIKSKENRRREIKVNVYNNSKGIVIDYYDTGPGLSRDIEEPEEIFKPLFTTRRNPFTGDEEGTGLGMWLVKSIINENDGKVQLLYPSIGFGLRMTFPVKYQK